MKLRVAVQAIADMLLGATLTAALWLRQTPVGVLVVAGIAIGLLVVRRMLRAHQRQS